MLTKGALVNSWQFDAAIDQQGILHLVSDQYYRFDLSGNLQSTENQAQDFQQYNLAFPPSLSLDPQGKAHMLLRGPGNVAAGVDLSYRVRETDGNWPATSRNYTLGPPEPRNNVLAVTAGDNDQVYAHHGKTSSGVSGDLLFWKLDDLSPQYLGNWSGIWRADLDTRMRSQSGKVYFASANSSSTNHVYFSIAEASDSLLNDLKTNVRSHTAGSGRRGGPDIQIDNKGNAHLIYGAYHEVYYNRYLANGNKVFSDDKRILNTLGNWHLNFGIASLGVSENGSRILALGLKTDGTKLADHSQLLMTYSADGGLNWSEPLATGIYTHGGESRMRPRIMRHKGHFYIVYFDWAHAGLALASIAIETLTQPAATAGATTALTASRLLLLD